MRFMKRTSRAGLPLLLMALLLVVAACAPQEEAGMADEPAGAVQEAAMQEAPQAIPLRANEARPSPNASVSQTIGTTVVTLTYGRPGVKGRRVFGGLEAYGTVWRAGANEATVFSATSDVTINGEALPAGVYAFFAIPNEGDWTLIFNKQAEQWGAFNYDESQDALRVTATPQEADAVEWLAYYFGDLTGTSATAYLHWDTTRVPFTISTE